MSSPPRALGFMLAMAITTACARAPGDVVRRTPLSSGAASAPAAASPPPTKSAVESLMSLHHRPGVAAAVTKDGVIIWHGAFGLADVEGAVPVTDATTFTACSLSKPVTLVAVMQIVEDLARERGTSIAAVLDDDIERLVVSTTARGFSFRNPGHPDAPITLRMLLAHTSGVHDNYAHVPHDTAVSAPAYVYRGPSLRAAIADYVSPWGSTFAPENFRGPAPGARAEYSSIGTAAAALVVDVHASGGFEAYTRARIFAPLGMGATGWRLAELASHGPLQLAVPYASRDVALGRWAVRVTPEAWEQTFSPGASLRTTALDYARFVAALAGGKLLKEDTMTEVLRVQYPHADGARGLVLMATTRAGVRVVGHDGQNVGFRSSMFFTPRGATADGSTYGVVIFTNGDATVAGAALEPKLGDELLARAMAGSLVARSLQAPAISRR